MRIGDVVDGYSVEDRDLGGMKTQITTRIRSRMYFLPGNLARVLKENFYTHMPSAYLETILKFSGAEVSRAYNTDLIIDLFRVAEWNFMKNPFTIFRSKLEDRS